MSLAKTKNDKAKHHYDIVTLDETHRKYMSNFQKRKETLPQKYKKLERIRKNLEKIEKTEASSYSTDDIKFRSKYKEDIRALEEEIYDIENDLSEIDYYSKIDDIVMDYYEKIDHGDDDLYDLHPELMKEKTTETQQELDRLDILNLKNKDQKKNKKTTTKRRNKGRRGINPANKTVFSYFGKTDVKSEEAYANTEMARNRAQLLDTYLTLTDTSYVCKKRKLSDIKRCEECNKEKRWNPSESVYTCEECGEVEMVIMDSEKPNYKEAVTDSKPGYPYKRINELCVIAFYK